MNIIKKIVYFLTLIGVLVFLSLKWNDLNSILSLNAKTIIILIFLAFLHLIINGIYFHSAIKFFGLRLEIIESIGLTALNTMYAYLLPAKTGIVFRAFYLNKKHSFPYRSNITFLLGNLIINGILSLIIASIISIPFWRNGEISDYTFYGILALTPLSIIILYLLDIIKIPDEKINNRLIKFLKVSIADIRTFKNNKGLLFTTILGQFLLMFVGFIRLYVTFKMLGFEVDFLRVITVQVLLNFSLLISITPGNLGVSEGIIAFSATFLSLTIDEALLVAVIDRTMLMVVIFILGMYFSHTLLKDLDKKHISYLK